MSMFSRKKFILNKYTFLIIISLFLGFSQPSLYALELTDIQDSLSEGFGFNLGNNEGTTSFRSLLIPMGGRAESLGTAFTGLADDVNYIDYNPAASSILKTTEISLFHNSWIADSAMESLVATTRFNHLGLGAKINCFYVPFSEYDSYGQRVANSYYSESSAVFNISYNFLPGYYFKGIAVGANAKIAWRSIPDYTDNDTGEIISNSGLSQSALGIMGDIGMLLQFNFMKLYNSRDTNLKIGISALNLGTAFTGWANESMSKIDDPLPSVMQLGISYKVIEPLLLTLEFKQPFNLFNITEYQTFSVGTGIQFDFNKTISVMAGFLIKGGNPRISIGSDIEIRKIRFNINYTLDLTSSANPINRISIGAKMILSDKGRSITQKNVDKFYHQGLVAYAQGNYEEAILQWKLALDLDKYFDPALEGIKSAKMQILMFQKLQDIQHFDTSN